MKPFGSSPHEKTGGRGYPFLAATVAFFALLVPVFAATRGVGRAPSQTVPAKAAQPPDAMREKMPSHYEKSHLSGRPFIIGVVAFFILITGIFTTVWGLVEHWSGQTWPHRAPPAPPSATAGWDTRVPQIQIDPDIDLANLRQLEFRRLHAPYWTDASHTFATIPIEDAMNLLANAAAKGQLLAVLPAPQPATPVQLQDQKSREISPPQAPNP
jgi:hypothetical protein